MEGAYALVWGGASTSNLFEPPSCRAGKVCRVLLPAFGEVGSTEQRPLYRGSKVCRLFCTSSGWFKHVEPPRIFSNKSLSETARCVEFFNRKGVVHDELCEREFSQLCTEVKTLVGQKG